MSRQFFLVSHSILLHMNEKQKKRSTSKQTERTKCYIRIYAMHFLQHTVNTVCQCINVLWAASSIKSCVWNIELSNDCSQQRTTKIVCALHIAIKLHFRAHSTCARFDRPNALLPTTGKGMSDHNNNKNVSDVVSRCTCYSNITKWISGYERVSRKRHTHSSN